MRDWREPEKGDGLWQSKGRVCLRGRGQVGNKPELNPGVTIVLLPGGLNNVAARMARRAGAQPGTLVSGTMTMRVLELAGGGGGLSRSGPVARQRVRG